MSHANAFLFLSPFFYIIVQCATTGYYQFDRVQCSKRSLSVCLSLFRIRLPLPLPDFFFSRNKSTDTVDFFLFTSPLLFRPEKTSF